MTCIAADHEPGATLHAARLQKCATTIEDIRMVFRLLMGPLSATSATFVDHAAATPEWEHRPWRDAVTGREMNQYFQIT